MLQSMISSDVRIIESCNASWHSAGCSTCKHDRMCQPGHLPWDTMLAAFMASRSNVIAWYALFIHEIPSIIAICYLLHIHHNVGMLPANQLQRYMLRIMIFFGTWSSSCTVVMCGVLDQRLAVSWGWAMSTHPHVSVQAALCSRCTM